MIPEFPAAPDPAVQVLEIGRERRKLLIVDQLLADPEALVEYAAATPFAPLQNARNFYPGVRAPAPQAYAASLFAALRPLLAEVFAAPVEGKLRLSCVLSLATLPAEALNTAQCIPHVDTVDAGQLAILHYLCDPRHGGTGFYRHRATGFETLDRDRGPAYFAALEAELAAEPPAADYVRASTGLFEQIARVEAVFNRVVVYESRLLHSGVIDPASGLSPDPREGRLTANAFLTWA